MPEDIQQVIYTEEPTPESQPLANPVVPSGRRYIGAKWKPAGEGGGHPKISGGYETDTRGHPITARGFNRPDQRYTAPAADLRAKRETRAMMEVGDTSVTLISGGRVGIRTITGNIYRVDPTALTCDCPDMVRLRANPDYDDVYCKHILIAQIAIGQGTPQGLPWSCAAIAEAAGCEPRTVENHIRQGHLTASKINGVWNVPPANAQAFAAWYLTQIVGKEGQP